MNKVILTGRLGADPTIRLAQNGTLVANLSLATNERYTAKDGTKVESPEWHQVVMFLHMGIEPTLIFVYGLIVNVFSISYP